MCGGGWWAGRGRCFLKAGEYGLCSSHSIIQLAHLPTGGTSQSVSGIQVPRVVSGLFCHKAVVAKEVSNVGGHVLYVLYEVWLFRCVEEGLYPPFHGDSPLCYVCGMAGGQGIFDLGVLGLCEVL